MIINICNHVHKKTGLFYFLFDGAVELPQSRMYDSHTSQRPFSKYMHVHVSIFCVLVSGKFVLGNRNTR